MLLLCLTHMHAYKLLCFLASETQLDILSMGTQHHRSDGMCGTMIGA